MYWHYSKAGERHGPITAARLKVMVTTGQLSPDDLVWREDMKEWRKASTVKGLFPEGVKNQVSTGSSPLPSMESGGKDAKSTTPKRLLLGCLLFPVLISLLLPAVQKARDAARKAQAERQSTVGNVQTAAEPSHVKRVEEALVRLGSFQEVGESFFDKLSFAKLDEQSTALPIPLSTEFFQSGGFRFRGRGFGSQNEVTERSTYLEFRLSPQDVGTLQCRASPYKHEIVNMPYSDTHQVYRLNTLPGDMWEWCGGEVRVEYVRSVKLGDSDCAVIEIRGFLSSGLECHRVVEWWVRDVGMVRRDTLMLSERDVVTISHQAFLVDPSE
jgi:hypothetical protein